MQNESKENKTMVCPMCGSTMRKFGNTWKCEKCGHTMPVDEKKDNSNK